MKKVSVIMLTYNHEKFIAQAIASVLDQKVNFDFELIVADDASVDNTQKIVKNFQDAYPDIIRPLLRDRNVGPANNFTDAFYKTTGKYVALLEGDDYWTDPDKLQKQVDFLEAHPDYVISFTDYRHLNEETGELVSHTDLHHRDTLTIDDLIRHNYISTLTCVFRNHLFDDFPSEYYKLKVGDWPLHVLNARFGKAKYHRGCASGVYRIHYDGVWSNESKKNKYLAYAEVNVFFKNILTTNYHKSLDKNIRYYYYAAISVLLQEGNLSEAKRLLNEMSGYTGRVHVDYLKIYAKYILTHANI